MVRPHERRGWRGPLLDLARGAALAAVYFLSGYVGLHVGTVGGFAAPVWPPSGIALVAFLLFGRRLWPGVAIGAFALNLSEGAPLQAAIGIGVGNTLEAVVATTILHRARFEVELARPRDVVALLCAAAASAPLSATIGTASLALSGAAPSSSAILMWVPWVVGDILSNLVLAPLLLVVATGGARGVASRTETALALVTVLALSIAILGEVLPPDLRRIFGRAYLIYPVLLWPSVRLGPRGSAIAMTIVSLVAIVATVLDRGGFTGDDQVTALIALQVFLGVVALTQLLLAAAVAESRLRDKLMSIASHELRGPLGTLSMALELMREDPSPPMIERAQRQVVRLTSLVQELLDATRVGAHRLMLKPEPTDLATLAASVLSRLEAELRVAKCEVELAAEPCVGTWDALRIDQLVTNLVSNAARHAPGAPITVRVERLEGHVRLCVADRGPGISRPVQAHIFDTYRSLDHKGPGLGLGLHIAREIVLAHGGTLRVESELGHGATFIAELPCNPPQRRHRPWRPARAVPKHA